MGYMYLYETILVYGIDVSSLCEVLLNWLVNYTDGTLYVFNFLFLQSFNKPCLKPGVIHKVNSLTI